MDGPVPESLTDWQGAPVEEGRPKGRAPELALHRADDQQPLMLSPKADDPQGVPISAIIFGGRRARRCRW